LLFFPQETAGIFFGVIRLSGKSKNFRCAPSNLEKKFSTQNTLEHPKWLLKKNSLSTCLPLNGLFCSNFHLVPTKKKFGSKKCCFGQKYRKNVNKRKIVFYAIAITSRTFFFVYPVFYPVSIFVVLIDLKD